MKHNKLLTMIEDKFNNHSGLHDAQIVNALYKVVELHKPHSGLNGSTCTCDSYDEYRMGYPCSTIQAIEKELI